MVWISAKLLARFLAIFVIHVLFAVFNILCGYLLSDFSIDKSFIHISLIRCKINKFISFFSQNQWKSYK